MITLYYVTDADGQYASQNPFYSLKAAQKYADKIGGEVSEDTEEITDED